MAIAIGYIRRVMPQFLTIAAVGAGLIAGARWARRALERRESERMARDHAKRSARARTVGELTLDQESGVYRPKSSGNT